MLKGLRSFIADSSTFAWPLFRSSRVRRMLEKGVLFRRVDTPFAAMESSGNPDVRAIVEPLRGWEQREQVMVVRGGAFVEPRGGWVICPPCHLVDDCVIDSSAAMKPALAAYVNARLYRKERVKTSGSVVNLRDAGESNYWHFLNDLVGGRLRLAASCGVDKSVPLLVGRQLVERPFFQEFLSRSGLSKRTLIVQGNEFIRSDEIFCFQTARHNLAHIEYVRRALGVAEAEPASARRTLVARAPRSGRHIENMKDIETLCGRYGFETVVLEGMSLDGQIRLFSESRFVIGVHGAGLSNVMFRKNARLSLLEIFPPGVRQPDGALPPHYCWLSHALGFGYDALFGSAVDTSTSKSSFRVVARTLTKKIEAMLDVGESGRVGNLDDH